MALRRKVCEYWRLRALTFEWLRQIVGLTACVTSCRGLPEEQALAFAMVAHPRLGQRSMFAGMLDDVLQCVVAASRVWPIGRAGKVEGVVRLLGGGL